MLTKSKLGKFVLDTSVGMGRREKRKKWVVRSRTKFWKWNNFPQEAKKPTHFESLTIDLEKLWDLIKWKIKCYRCWSTLISFFCRPVLAEVLSSHFLKIKMEEPLRELVDRKTRFRFFIDLSFTHCELFVIEKFLEGNKSIGKKSWRSHQLECHRCWSTFISLLTFKNLDDIFLKIKMEEPLRELVDRKNRFWFFIDLRFTH